jgi:hypothetical protein
LTVIRPLDAFTAAAAGTSGGLGAVRPYTGVAPAAAKATAALTIIKAIEIPAGVAPRWVRRDPAVTVRHDGEVIERRDAAMLVRREARDRVGV